MQICFLKNELKPSNIKRGEIIIVFSWPRNSSESRIASLGRSKKLVKTTPALRRSALPPSHPSHPHPSIPLDPNLGKKVDTDSPSPRFGPRRRSSGFYLVPSTAATTNAAAAIAPSTYLPKVSYFKIAKMRLKSFEAQENLSAEWKQICEFLFLWNKQTRKWEKSSIHRSFVATFWTFCFWRKLILLIFSFAHRIFVFFWVSGEIFFPFSNNVVDNDFDGRLSRRSHRGRRRRRCGRHSTGKIIFYFTTRGNREMSHTV